MKDDHTLEVFPLIDRLINKIHVYYSTIWQDRREDHIWEKWLENFSINGKDCEKEKLHALYLLSKFMYFGNLELRELIKCIYRDLYRYPIISQLRKDNNDTQDVCFLECNFQEKLSKTRFLGMGNPSESGVHLLYYFRQENCLQSELFINADDIFDRKILNSRIETNLHDISIEHYIFLDDFCGTGSQAVQYSEKTVTSIKTINPNAVVSYFMIFGTLEGIGNIKNNTQFDNVEAIFEIDDSFKCFSKNSRYFGKKETEIDKTYCECLCRKYGDMLWSHPLGYLNSQMLLSMFHNTPDNTLPIFWAEKTNWKPIFKRFNKK